MGKNDLSATHSICKPHTSRAWIIAVGAVIAWFSMDIMAIVTHNLKFAKLRALAPYRVTARNLEWWHDQLQLFVSTNRRSPSSLQELQVFARRRCADTNISYATVSRDGWGTPLRMRLEYCEECLLEVQSAGSDRTFGDEDRSVSFRRSHFYPIQVPK